MADIKFSKINTELEVKIDESTFKCLIVEKSFFDPKKKLPQLLFKNFNSSLSNL